MNFSNNMETSSLEAQMWFRCKPIVLLGRVVRKSVNANPRLKVNRGNNFSCIKVLSIAYVLLCSLRLVALKT